MSTKKPSEQYLLNQHNLKVIKRTLDTYSINTTLFNELYMLANNNPDQYFLLNPEPSIVPVSHILLHYSKQPKKLQKVLKKLNIYNVTRIRKSPELYTYMAKTSDGMLMMYELDVRDSSSDKVAFGMSLIDFINQINTGVYMHPNQTDITTPALTSFGLTPEQINNINMHIQSTMINTEQEDLKFEDFEWSDTTYQTGSPTLVDKTQVQSEIPVINSIS